MSTKNRFILATLLLVATVLGAASVFLFFSERQHLQRQNTKRQVESIRRLYTVCLDGVLTGHRQVTVRYIEQISVLPELAYAACLDAEGRVLVSGAPEAVKALPSEKLAAGVVKEMARTELDAPGTGRTLDYLYRIQSEGRTLGWARMGHRVSVVERGVRDAVLESLLRFVQWSIPLASLLGALVGYLLATWLSKPIDLLTAGARRIGEGRLDHRIELERGDELGTLAEEFNQMARKLAELDRLREDFLHMLTHDMRNPLAALRGHAELLLAGARGSVTPAQKESLEIVMRASQGLSELITDMLDLAKLEAEKMRLERRPMRLAETAREVVLLFRSLSEKEKIALEVREEDPGAVSGDERLLRRVLTNLVSNALKFTPSGGRVAVAVSRAPDGVVCAVTDTGQGIPVADQAKLFSKFHQASNRDAVRRSTGTGLGLAICKSVVEAHGGTIRVESAEGRGTTITFTLPSA